jgi:nicotinamidase-related amidase
VLKIDNTVLIVIDIQGKLADSMNEKDALLENLQKLAQGAQVLGLPVILTEQNPLKLGPTKPELTQYLPGAKAIPKMAFSCYADPVFKQAFDSINRRQVLIAGIEAHVCVYQTAVELMNLGCDVQVIADAVSSRTAENRDIAVSRIANEGAKLTSVEMVLFELLQSADNVNFRAISKLVK